MGTVPAGEDAEYAEGMNSTRIPVTAYSLQFSTMSLNLLPFP